MSLEQKFFLYSKKNVLEPQNSTKTYQNIINQIGDELSKSNLSSNIGNYFSDYQLSSHYSEESKRSLESINFSQEISNLLKKNANTTEKNIEENLKSTKKKLVFEENQENVINQCPENAMPEIQVQKFSEVQKNSMTFGPNTKTSLRSSTFALTNRIFCMKCSKDVFTNVNYETKKMSFWGSLGFILDSFKCCGEANRMSRYQEIVHSCKVCGNVVARISSN